MERQFKTRHFACAPAAALSICRECIWNHACQRCAFDQWLDETSPKPAIVIGPNRESEILSAAA